VEVAQTASFALHHQSNIDRSYWYFKMAFCEQRKRGRLRYLYQQELDGQSRAVAGIADPIVSPRAIRAQVQAMDPGSRFIRSEPWRR